MSNIPKMTAEDARTFDSFSRANYALLKAELTCGCEPYNDVFTLKRWNAQGYRIVKGQKAHRITVFIHRDVEDEETGKVKHFSRPWTAYVFCRCQVKAVAK